eukprot:181441_1
MLLNVHTWAAYSVCALGVIVSLAIIGVTYSQCKRVPIIVRCCTYTNNDNKIDFWCGMEYKDIRSVCLQFIGLNVDHSQILTVSAQQDLWQLFSSHFNSKSYHKVVSMSLLYSATQQTFYRPSFFSMVGKKTNIVILMRNEHNHIFGGYSSVGMPTDSRIKAMCRITLERAKSFYNGNGFAVPQFISRYIEDPKSFIFCVQSRLYSKPIIFQRRVVGLKTDIGACFDLAFEFGTEDMSLIMNPYYTQSNALGDKAIHLRPFYYQFDATQFGSPNELNGHHVKCKLDMIEVFQLQM